MFFKLSKTQDNNFPVSFYFNDLYLNVDQGWSVKETDENVLVYKGYTIESNLADQLDTIVDQQLPTFAGNFCLFQFDKSNYSVTIKNSRDRSFPIYYSQTDFAITNLSKLESTVWSDKIVSIDKNLKISEYKFDAVGDIDTDTLSQDAVVQQLYNILYQDVYRFLSHNKLPVKVFLSGGVDSMLVYSFVKKITKDYKLVDGNYFEYDEFWCLNRNTIVEQYWGYSQLHHWRAPTLLTSGAPGDEFLLRSPTTANLFLMHHGTNIINLLDRPSLHQKYFSKDKHLAIFNQQILSKESNDIAKDKSKLFYQLCDINLNDWQHWHLGNTLTFTPLRNIELFKLMLRLPLESAIGQILDSTISKQLIAMNDQSLLQYLSTDKNYDSFNNLWPYLSKNISATSGQ